MPLTHLVVRARYPLNPFERRDACLEAWRRLRSRFSKTLGCLLMPNHLHLLLSTPSPELARRELMIEMSAFSQSVFPGKRIWEEAPSPEPIRDFHHLKRQIRYVHLNPCRRGLAADPLEWEWSTHRDAVGACASPWLDLPAIQPIWKVRPRDFPAAFHHYVSGDPTVSIVGTPLPEHRSGLVVPLDRLEWAVVNALRAATDSRLERSPARRLMIHAADRLAQVRKTWIADWIGVSDRAVLKTLAHPLDTKEQQALSATFLLLSAPERFEVTVRKTRTFGPTAASGWR